LDKTTYKNLIASKTANIAENVFGGRFGPQLVPLSKLKIKKKNTAN